MWPLPREERSRTEPLDRERGRREGRGGEREGERKREEGERERGRGKVEVREGGERGRGG